MARLRMVDGGTFGAGRKVENVEGWGVFSFIRNWVIPFIIAS
jgi:hypothetical protein